MKKIITIGALFASIMFGYNADNAAKDLACKTITADAYYSKYAQIDANNWWTYVSNDGKLVIAHQQGTTVKDMGTSFFVISNKFTSAPVFSYVNGKIEMTFPPVNDNTLGYISDLSNKTVTADAYYSKYAQIDGNNWWTYVSTDGKLIIAHQQGTTVKDMGTSFFVISNKFNGVPKFSYINGKIEITFPPLAGENSCETNSSSNTDANTPPQPESDNSDLQVPPAVPSIK